VSEAISGPARVNGTSALPPPYGPAERDSATVAPAGSYHTGDPVWVHRGGAWRLGVVEAASSRAVLARYSYANGIGTTVDTVWAECVAARTSPDLSNEDNARTSSISVA
jgi:hypothetical protein